MISSLYYKEWIKTRWFAFTYMVIAIAAIAYIFIKVQHDINFSNASLYWYSCLFSEYTYYHLLKYIPLVGGAIIGLTQYLPETVHKRIKLTFHLPIDEEKVLLHMNMYGALLLTVIYTIILVIFGSISFVYFPKEMINTAASTILPWFLSGYAIYFLIATIVLEPQWKYRLLYILLGLATLSLYFEHANNGAYAKANIELTILTVGLSIGLLLSGYRLRKGE